MRIKRKTSKIPKASEPPPPPRVSPAVHFLNLYCQCNIPVTAFDLPVDSDPSASELHVSVHSSCSIIINKVQANVVICNPATQAGMPDPT